MLHRSYFSKDGIEYNLGRVPIGGTDFSTRGYTYSDNSTDASLKSFSLTIEDLKYKVNTLFCYYGSKSVLLVQLYFFETCLTHPKFTFCHIWNSNR